MICVSLNIGLRPELQSAVACRWTGIVATCSFSPAHAGSRPDEAIFFFKLPNPPAALGPGAHSAANRNEYPKQKNNVSGEQSVAGA
jgi:hypothetical protein